MTVHARHLYRVSHLLIVIDLVWVDFDLGAPPSCPASQPLLPNSHQPRQNWADSATLKIQVNQVHEQVHKQMGHPELHPDTLKFVSDTRKFVKCIVRISKSILPAKTATN